MWKLGWFFFGAAALILAGFLAISCASGDDDDGDSVDDDDDEFDGPFSDQTDENGRYDIYIGPLDRVGGNKYEAKVIGSGNVTSEDTVEWETSKDCHDGGEIQVMQIEWGYKPN